MVGGSNEPKHSSLFNKPEFSSAIVEHPQAFLVGVKKTRKTNLMYSPLHTLTVHIDQACNIWICEVFKILTIRYFYNGVTCLIQLPGWKETLLPPYKIMNPFFPEIPLALPALKNAPPLSRFPIFISCICTKVREHGKES